MIHHSEPDPDERPSSYPAMNRASPDRFEQGRPMLLAGLRRRHDFDAASRDIPKQWVEFNSWQPLANRAGPGSYGVMCGVDPTGFEYMCAVEVSSLEGLPEGVGRMRVPAQHYAVFAHGGHVSSIRDTWDRAFRWLEDGAYESAHKPDFELYGPRYDPVTMQGGIEIWIGVVKRGG